MTEPVDYIKATSVAEACALAADNPEARFVSGGTALAIFMRLGLVRPALLIGVGGIAELGETRVDQTLFLGAGVRLRDAENMPGLADGWPAVAETLKHVATPRIRNMATVGGGVAHADPNQDPPVTYVVLDAVIHVTGPQAKRSIPAREFFVDYYETVLEEGELITSIEIPRLPKRAGAAFLKFLPRSVDDYGTVTAAARVTVDADGTLERVEVSFGGVGSTPVLVDLTDDIAGTRHDAPLPSAAADRIRESTDPTEDVRGSVEYKRDMAAVFGGRAMHLAALRALGKAN